MLEKIRKRAARIALQARQQTPTIYLEEILASKSVKQRKEEAQVKMWHKYSRAPSDFLQHKIFNDWKDYFIENDETCLRSNGEIVINDGKFPHVSKSPLSRGFKLIQTISDPNKRILPKKMSSVTKAPPIYQTQFPTNVTVSRT